MFIVVLFVRAEKGEENPNIHQLMNGQTKCEIALQWSIIHQQKKQNTD